LFEFHKDFVLGSRVLHADETIAALLDPGAGKTKTAYLWAYARSAFDPAPGVVFDFCTGRGSEYPFKFLGGWSGTLLRDGYAGYDKALLVADRIDAGCMAHYPERRFIWHMGPFRPALSYQRLPLRFQDNSPRGVDDPRRIVELLCRSRCAHNRVLGPTSPIKHAVAPPCRRAHGHLTAVARLHGTAPMPCDAPGPAYRSVVFPAMASNVQPVAGLNGRQTTWPVECG
jgi:hypothetical protein